MPGRDAGREALGASERAAGLDPRAAGRVSEWPSAGVSAWAVDRAPGRAAGRVSGRGDLGAVERVAGLEVRPADRVSVRASAGASARAAGRVPGRAAGRLVLDRLVAGAVLDPFGAGVLMASPSASPDADVPVYQASADRVARRK